MYLIAGASSGIGRATAVLFSKLGANLSLVGRSEEGLAKTSKQCGTNTDVYTVTGDLTKESDIENIVNNTISNLGKLDILVRQFSHFSL